MAQADPMPWWTVSDRPGGFVEDTVDDGLLAEGGHYKAFQIKF